MAIESLGKTFVIICTFLGVLALLVTGAFSIIGLNGLSDNQHSSSENDMLSNTYSIHQLSSITKTYDFLTPVVMPIDNISVGSYWAIDRQFGLIISDATYVEFVPITNDNNILMWLTKETVIVHALPSDYALHPVYLYFHQAWGGVFGIGRSWVDFRIGIDDVLNNFNTADGVSYIDIRLKESYTIILTPDAGTSMSNDWNTHSRFNVSLAQTITNASMVEPGDAFQIIAQIMSFSVPNVGSWVNLILAAVLIPTYTILIFFVVRSFIPLLGG